MKKIIKEYNITRLAVQIVFFIFLPALFSAAFNGVKYLADQVSRHELIVSNPFIATLVALLAFTVFFGRFFCGYACAFGSLGDWLFACFAFARNRAGKKVLKLPDKAIAALLYLKYLILIGVVIACFLNVYASFSHADPWGLFASLRTGVFSIEGKEWAAVTLGLIVIGMIFVERFFCMFLCPLGAVFALLPMFPLMVFNRKKEGCIPGCTLCTKTCPASISLGEAHSKYDDCFQCGTCSMKCPKSNIRLGLRKLKGTEIWLVALKSAILFALCYPLMN
jgi:polyferredoxin